MINEKTGGLTNSLSALPRMRTQDVSQASAFSYSTQTGRMPKLLTAIDHRAGAPDIFRKQA